MILKVQQRGMKIIEFELMPMNLTGQHSDVQYMTFIHTKNTLLLTIAAEGSRQKYLQWWLQYTCEGAEINGFSVQD